MVLSTMIFTQGYVIDLYIMLFILYEVIILSEKKRQHLNINGNKKCGSVDGKNRSGTVQIGYRHYSSPFFILMERSRS